MCGGWLVAVGTGQACEATNAPPFPLPQQIWGGERLMDGGKWEKEGEKGEKRRERRKKEGSNLHTLYSTQMPN